MANGILCFPNRADDSSTVTVSYSGGSWEASFPLVNMKNSKMFLVSRSTDAVLASTLFDVNFGSVRDLKVFAFPRHNLRQNARVKIRLSNVAGSFSGPDLIYDSDWFDVWSVVFPFGTLYWGHPSFWTGKYSDEDYVDVIVPMIHVLDEIQYAQYARIEIDDEDNPDGYVEINRFVAAPGFQPTYNFEYDLEEGYETDTVVERALGGNEFYDRREGRRITRFQISGFSDEMKTWVLDMQRKLGIDGQLFFIYDPEDETNRHRQSYLATMRRLSPMTHPFYNWHNAPFELQEVL